MKNKALKTAISVLLSLLIATSCCVVMAEEPEVDLTMPEVASAEENAAFWQSLCAMTEEQQSQLFEQLAADFTETSTLNIQEELGLEADDEDDDGSGALSIILGMGALFEGLTSFDISKQLDWSGKVIGAMVHNEQANRIMKGINQLNQKADEINKKLDEVEKQLIKLGKQVEVTAIENDLQSARAASKLLTTFVDEVRESKLSDPKATDTERANAFVSIMDTHFPKVYTDINNLSHFLADSDNIHTKKSLFYNIKWLTKSNYFVWDSWEIAFQELNVANFTVTYLEALSYLFAIITYARDKAVPDSRQQQDYNNKLNVSKKNFNKVKTQWEANKIKPIGGTDDTVSFNFGQGKYLTLSKYVRGLGLQSGVYCWQYPEGVNKSNITRDIVYEMAYAKEKITSKKGETKTLYALKLDQYKLWGKYLKENGNSIGIDPNMRPYYFIKSAGFYMGDAKAPGAALAENYGAGLNSNAILKNRSPYVFEQGINLFFEKDTIEALELFAYKFACSMWFAPTNNGIIDAMSISGNNLLMYLTPDASVGAANSRYTLEKTLLTTRSVGDPVAFNLISENYIWNHDDTEDLTFSVLTGDGVASDIISSEAVVCVDEQELDPSCYEIDGDTIILKTSYLTTLKEGVYQLELEDEDFYALGGFYIKDNPEPVEPEPENDKPGANNDVPKTGDGSNIPYIALTAMLCAVAFVFIKVKKINR